MTKTQNSNNPPQLQINKLVTLFQKKFYIETEKLAHSILQDFPNYQLAWKILGSVLRQSGRMEEAIYADKKAIEISPNDAYAHNNLGISLKAIGKFSEAKLKFIKAISLKKNFPEAYNNIGTIYQALEKFDKAEENYKQAISIKPNFSEAYNNLGATLKAQKKFDVALKIYLQAIKLNPKNAQAYFNIGILYSELGKFDHAKTNYEQAIALKPDFAQAHRLLSSIKTFNSYDNQFSIMHEQYVDINHSDIHRCHINFALAKAYEDLNNYEQAFLHYKEGNSLKKKYTNFDLNKEVERFEKIKSNNNAIKKFSSKLNNKLDRPLPIFIIGMPRSGTTLVEQIISSHSKVTAGGELPYALKLGENISTDSTNVNFTNIQNFQTKYLDRLQHFSDGNNFITDKLPHNFLLTGLLATSFPEAKLIHVTRNPSAVCWSNYKLYSASSIHNYSYSLRDILSYYKLYRNLMDFWINSYSDRIYNLSYELLIDNQEYETRKLIHEVGLNWDEKCMSPHKNPRNIATPSSLQVRKEIYQGSSQEWKKYKPFLNGIFDFFEE